MVGGKCITDVSSTIINHQQFVCDVIIMMMYNKTTPNEIDRAERRRGGYQYCKK